MPFLTHLRNQARRAPDLFGCAALLLLCIAVFWPLLNGKAFFFGDLEIYFYPLTEFWRRELAAGHLPLWNPNLYSGVSFAGNPQIGLLYPASALLLCFPTITALAVSAILHIWCSGTVFFLWMRRGRLKLAPSAALLGAICWMLGGTFISKSQFPNMLAALAYLPAVIWAAEGLAERPCVRSSVVLGGVLGLQLLAAHAQVTLYTSYLLIFYAFWVWKSSPRLPPWKVAVGLLGAFVLAVLLDAGQILPVMENLRGTERQILTAETAPRFYLPPWAVTNLFAPYLYGNPNNGTWTFGGGGNTWETACYMGILPFSLAMRSLKREPFWAAIAILCLFISFGPTGGLYLLVLKYVPGVSRFHDSARFLMLTSLAFAVLAALGFQKLRQSPKATRLVPALLFFCALDLGIYARTFYPLRFKTQIPVLAQLPSPVTQKLGQGQTRIWTANPRDGRGLLMHSWDYTLRTPAHDALFPVGSVANTQVWDGFLEAGGYDPIAPAVVAKRLVALQFPNEAASFPPDYAAALGKNSIEFLSRWSKRPLPSIPHLRVAYWGPQTVDGRRLVVYHDDLARTRAYLLKPGGGWISGKVTALSANQLQVSVPAGGTALEINDNAFPGWVAFENQSPLPLTSTPGGYKKLDLKSAASAPQIRLTYAPQSFRLGVFLSLCALSLITALFLATKKPETK